MVGALLLTGCRIWSPQPDYPEDPLLQTLRPRELTVSAFSPTLQLAQVEPLMPRCHDSAFLAGDPQRVPLHNSARPVAAPPPASADLPQAALLVNHAQPALPVGQAPDCSWIQGPLVKLADGSLGIADPEARCVLLQPDPRLAIYKPGDVLYVEGEFTEVETGKTSSPNGYRIRLVRPGLPVLPGSSK